MDNEVSVNGRADALEHCKNGFIKVLDEIALSGATPVICTPVPYDEISESEVVNLNCRCGFDELSQFLRGVASERDYELVDFSENIKITYQY